MRFPKLAIDRVEILRDGASAPYEYQIPYQNVINIILKKDVNKLYAQIGVSGYNDPTYAIHSTTLIPNQYYTGTNIDGFNAEDRFELWHPNWEKWQVC